MKKILCLFMLFLISGCYSPVGMWFRSNFSFSCPNKYEKEIIRDSCNSETVKLKLEEHIWKGDGQYLPEVLAQMKQQVINEKLYINEMYVCNWRGDIAIVIFASNVPTLLKDQDELETHKYHMTREETCNCRLCK